MKIIDPDTKSLSNGSTIAVLLISVAGMGTVIGLSFPLLTLTLERLDYSVTLIGINTAIGSLGILAVGLYKTRVLRTFGAFAPMLLSVAVTVASLFAMPVIDHAVGWFVLRFTLALGLGFIWLVSESWLNALATQNNRGRIIGLYATAFAIGFAIGPILIAVLGSQGWIPFVAAAIIMVVSALPMLMLAGKSILGEVGGTVRFSLFRLAPAIFWIALAAGAFETTAFALLPVFTLNEGISEVGSMYALSAFSAGGIALQFPLGRLADKHGRHAMMMVTAIGILLCSAALPLVVTDATALMVLLFFWGGLIFGLYTLGLVLLGDKYRAEDMVAANALFIMFYEFGAFGGPAITGMTMDIWPSHGFTGTLLISSGLLLILTLIYKRRNPNKHQSG